ncbi:unnamed protein product [Adineta steineri]|uniref:G-protein coupled receptors family 1 profile domain-containing protein n=1 Tax=Adineta steineri TaxID=433720 RepID=A0A814Y086_9BILA|nr:unnamed protein product [Adineta steineri]
MEAIDIINILNGTISIVSKIFPMILLIIGTFGHVCNLLIFSKRTQRTNPTSVCFLANTIVNLISLYFGMLPRYLTDIVNIDLINTNVTVCKLRSFFQYLSLSLSNWFLLLATIDRYIISSNDHTRRRLSNLKRAWYSIGFLTILFILLYCHILILYNIQSSFCYPRYGPYRLFNDIQIFIQYSLLPPILMTLFGLLTIRNIHLTRRHSNNQGNIRVRQRDIQLSKMLLLQVIITVICSLPLIISNLEVTTTLTIMKSPLRLAIENFLSQIARHLAYLNCSISFYLYTLTGSKFRLESRQIINQFSMFLCRRRILNRRQIGIDNRPIGPSTREPRRQ